MGTHGTRYEVRAQLDRVRLWDWACNSMPIGFTRAGLLRKMPLPFVVRQGAWKHQSLEGHVASSYLFMWQQQDSRTMCTTRLAAEARRHAAGAPWRQPPHRAAAACLARRCALLAVGDHFLLHIWTRGSSSSLLGRPVKALRGTARLLRQAGAPAFGRRQQPARTHFACCSRAGPSDLRSGGSLSAPRNAPRHRDNRLRRPDRAAASLPAQPPLPPPPPTPVLCSLAKPTLPLSHCLPQDPSLISNAAVTSQSSSGSAGMAAQVAGAPAPAAAPRLPLSSEDEAAADGGPLGLLDLTTREVSLAGLEKEIEACGDSEVLRAILDQGACCGVCEWHVGWHGCGCGS